MSAGLVARWQDGRLPDETKVELGKVQQTLFFPLLFFPTFDVKFLKHRNT